MMGKMQDIEAALAAVPRSLQATIPSNVEVEAEGSGS